MLHFNDIKLNARYVRDDADVTVTVVAKEVKHGSYSQILSYSRIVFEDGTNLTALEYFPLSPVPIPPVLIDLANMQNSRSRDEWEMTNDENGRTVTLASGMRTPDVDGFTVWMNQRGWTRAELPELIAFLSAVYTASEPEGCRQCGKATTGDDDAHYMSAGMMYCGSPEGESKERDE